MNDERLGRFSSLSNVKSLTLHNTRVTGAHIPTSLQPAAARYISVNDTPLHDAGFERLVRRSAERGTLRVVALERTHVSPASWLNMLSLALAARTETFWALELSHPGVTDADLVVVGKLRPRTLSLNCPQVTSQGLAELLRRPRGAVRLFTLSLSIEGLDGPTVQVLAELMANGTRIDLSVGRAESLRAVAEELKQAAATGKLGSIVLTSREVLPEDANLWASLAALPCKVSVVLPTAESLPQLAEIPLERVFVQEFRRGDVALVKDWVYDLYLGPIPPSELEPIAMALGEVRRNAPAPKGWIGYQQQSFGYRPPRDDVLYATTH